MSLSKKLPLVVLIALMTGSSSAQILVDNDGLLHLTLGGATAASSLDSRLVVSNIGSSGEDGVSIDLPGVHGFDTTFKSPTATGPNPVIALEYLVLATVMAKAQQTVLPYGSEFSGDFSGIGATTCQVQLENSGMLVYDGSHGDPFPGLLVAASGDFNVSTGWNGSDLEIVFDLPEPEPCFPQDGTGPFQADRVIFKATNPTGGAIPFDQVDIQAADVGSFEIRDERVDPFGTGPIEILNGTLDPVPFSTCSCGIGLGGSAQNGSIYIPTGGPVDLFHFNPNVDPAVGLDLGTAAGPGEPMNPILQLPPSSFGGVDVAPEPGVSPTWQVEVFDDGLLVGTYTGLAPPVCELPGMPGQIETTFQAATPSGPIAPTFDLSGGFTGCTIPGVGPVNGDRIVVAPEAPVATSGNPIGGFQLVSTAALGLTGFHFTSQPVGAAWPGSDEGLHLFTNDENGVLTGGPGEDVKAKDAGSLLELRIFTIDPDLEYTPILLGAQFFNPPTAPTSPLPGVVLDPVSAFLLYGAQGPLGSGLLSPSGLDLAFTLPPALANTNLLMQAAALTPLAQNGFVATSDGMQIDIGPVAP